MKLQDVKTVYTNIDICDWYLDSYVDPTQPGFSQILEMRYKKPNLPEDIVFRLMGAFPIGMKIIINYDDTTNYTITERELVRGTLNGENVTWFTLTLVPF